MNIEPNHSLQARARKHAALGDSHRLRVVDLLTLGDLSVTELQEELTMQSNLLAHHLKALEEVGIITRHRSEGDRRRSYVTLAPGSLELMSTINLMGDLCQLFPTGIQTGADTTDSSRSRSSLSLPGIAV